jgi:phosphinothricin acetyltransferase
MQILPMTDEHADAVLAIYQAGIHEGNATFETTAPTQPAQSPSPASVWTP